MEGGSDPHVVYVDVGEKRQRRLSHRLHVVGMVFFAAMMACVAITARRDSFAFHQLVMAEQQITEQAAVEAQLASFEITSKLEQRADRVLPAAAKEIAQQLAANPGQMLVDCQKMEAYVLLQTSFLELAANMSIANETLWDRDMELESKSAAAKTAWLQAQAAYRNAEADLESATEAAAYARSQYSVYEAAVEQGQKQYDKFKPEYDEEKTQLLSEKPILNEILELMKKMGTSRATAKSEKDMVLLKQMVNGLIVPKSNAKVAQQIASLKGSMLAETGSDAMVATMTAVVQELIDGITKRITEIETQTLELEADMQKDKTKLSDWEEKVVTLSDTADKAKNEMQSKDLVRNQLSGEHSVQETAYEDFHASFLDDSAKYARELAALDAINSKIADAIKMCKT